MIHAPYYGRLIELLIAAPWRVNAAGQIQITHAEAAMLRTCDFPTASAGSWTIPPLPREIVEPRARYLPASLTVLPLASMLAPTPPPPPSPTPVVSPTAVPIPTRAPCSAEAGTPSLRDLLARWWQAAATADERRLLGALVRRQDGVTQRRLQQTLHRLPAHRFHASLDGLLAFRLVDPEGTTLKLDPEVRECLIARGLGVSRLGRVRAIATRKRRRRRVGFQIRRGRLVARWPIVRGRRLLPPRGTSDWGRSMRAKRGGYARQQKCRRRGIHPTAEATRVRFIKRALAQSSRRRR